MEVSHSKTGSISVNAELKMCGFSLGLTRMDRNSQESDVRWTELVWTLDAGDGAAR